ncbi:MAG: AmmeMemoRadiSam system protein B [bacterium]
MQNKKIIPVLLLIIIISSAFLMISKIRKPIDPVGFATRSGQMDSLMQRIQKLQGNKLSEVWDHYNLDKFSRWSVSVCPHDDYTYAGWLYPAVLRNVNARTLILIGVAHKAKQYGIEGKLIFDKHTSWQGPYGPVRISSFREKLMNQLPRSVYTENDSLHESEHSLEALIPYLQYFNSRVEIIPVLIPAMSFNTMDGIALSFARAIQKVMEDATLTWKNDLAIVISNDAVHYGDEGWGGQNYAPYGSDSAGYKKALAYEYEIIGNCLTGILTKDKIRRFTEYTVQDTNFRTYKWTWCGRYAVPLGLLTGFYVQQNLRLGALKGTLLGYNTSIGQNPIPVNDLGLGTTAEANLHHWVGYAAIGYK